MQMRYGACWSERQRTAVAYRRCRLLADIQGMRIESNQIRGSGVISG